MSSPEANELFPFGSADPPGQVATKPSQAADPKRFPLRGYGPVLALVAAFVVMVAVVPSKVSTSSPVQGGVEVGAAGASSSEGRAASGNVTPCPDRDDQVPDDPYSPPCFSFSGDNGGSTSRGVSAEKIKVSYRVTSDPDYLSTIQQFAKSDLPKDTPQDVQRTMEGLVEYFNRNFQFYGRKIELVPFDAKGTVLGEMFGGGQDSATADAVKAATEVEPFADISAMTVPYNDALTRRKVIALGAPYVSDEYFQERRPYAWSIVPSCTLVSKASVEYANKRLFGKPAVHAKGDLEGRPRKIAIVTPDNPEYQRCADAGDAEVKKAGNDVLRLTYSLDIATMPNQAAALISRLKDEGITSVGCGCDPLLPIFLTGKATEQDYFPEWLVMGTALTDSDVVGELYDQKQWAQAMGASALGDQLPLTENLAAKAYRSVRQDRPASSSELLYFQLYQLAIGLQMAGPNLTPDTFEAGLFNYPERTGEGGTWKFMPGKYTPQMDARQIFWDPEAVSVLTGKKGAYVTDGKRYRLGQIPDTVQVPDTRPQKPS